MTRWIPLMLLMLGLALTLFSASLTITACKKSEPARADVAVDTAAVLPAPPELEPVDDLFAEDTLAPAPEPVAEKPAPKKIDPSSGLVPGGAYTLQVGIFNSERQASRLAEKLKTQGFPAYVTRVQDPTPELQGTYYRVRVGAFKSSSGARAYGKANLAPQGIAFWADLKGRDTQPVNQVFKPKPLPAPAPKAAPPAPAPASKPVVPQAKPVDTAPPAPAPAQDTGPASSLPDW